MAKNSFTFKEFTINQVKSAFKVGTDGVLLGALAEVSEVRRILDIGAGTGLISIMLAQRCNAEIIAIEPDRESFDQTCENVNQCRWNNRIEVLNVDLQGFKKDTKKFDLIITNPPYFTNSLKNPDPRRSSSRHNDSLPSATLLEGVSQLLQDDGRFQLIMPYVEGTIFIADAHKYGFYCNNIVKVRPLPSAEIRRLVMIFSRKKLQVKERYLTIEHGKRHEFTEEYINITKDFYLKF